MGWTDDLSTVSGALKQNFKCLGPLPVSSMTVGLAYLWEEREAELTDLSRSAELLMKDYPTPRARPPRIEAQPGPTRGPLMAPCSAPPPTYAKPRTSS